MPRFTWECPENPVALWKPSPLQWCASPGSFSVGNKTTVPIYAYKRQNLYANPWINEVERIGYMYIVPIICSFGVILNLFTIVVLSMKGFQGPPVVLLKGLAAADIVTTAVTLPFGFAYCILCPYNHDGYTMLIYQTYIYGPITNMSETVSAWTTILLGTERLATIKNMNLAKHQETGKVHVMFGMVVLAAVGLNFPFFYAFKIETVDILYFEKVYTSFGASVGFSVFSWIRAFLSQFLPLVYLCIINALLLYHVGRSVERCRKFSVFSNHSRREKAQMRMTAMLTGTIILFIAGHVPVAFTYVAIFQAVFGSSTVPSEFYSSFRVVTHSVALLSYTLDFVVYCLSNRHFRNSIVNTFIGKRKVSDINITMPTVINVQPSVRLGIKVGPQSGHQ